jgi:HEPN domain-containing protein
MNRSADGLHQAQADLDLARVSAGTGHHEWACFACHQAWGHGLGRSFRDLPSQVARPLAAAVSDLEDRLHILDTFYIPTRVPPACRKGLPPTISVVSRVTKPFTMPVRSLTPSVLRWPQPAAIQAQGRSWAEGLAATRPGLRRVGVFSSDGRAPSAWAVDLDLLLVEAGASGCGCATFPLRRSPSAVMPLCSPPRSINNSWRQVPGWRRNCSATPAGRGSGRHDDQKSRLSKAKLSPPRIRIRCACGCHGLSRRWRSTLMTVSQDIPMARSDAGASTADQSSCSSPGPNASVVMSSGMSMASSRRSAGSVVRRRRIGLGPSEAGLQEPFADPAGLDRWQC